PVLIAAMFTAVTAGAQVEWNELALPEHTFQEQAGEFRSDTIDIPLGPNGELEYKLGIEAGETIVYEWNVVDIDDPNLLYSEFHGHTEPVDNAGDLMFYRKAEGGSER